jgi:hypothetical protein
MAERDNRLISSAQILTSALPLAISLSPYCNDALALKEQQSATMIPHALMRLRVAGILACTWVYSTPLRGAAAAEALGHGRRLCSLSCNSCSESRSDAGFKSGPCRKHFARAAGLRRLCRNAQPLSFCTWVCFPIIFDGHFFSKRPKEIIMRAGATAWVLGHKVRLLETDESYGLIEVTSPPKCQDLRLTTTRASASFSSSVKGALDVMTDGVWQTMRAGSYVELPPGSVHTFINNTAEDVVWVTGWRPKGFSEVLRRIRNTRRPGTAPGSAHFPRKSSIKW